MQMERMQRMQPGMTRGRGACVDVGDEGPVCAARAVRRVESIRGAVDRVENAEKSLTSKRMWLARALDARMGGPVRAPSLVAVSLGHLKREEVTACVVHRHSHPHPHPRQSTRFRMSGSGRECECECGGSFKVVIG